MTYGSGGVKSLAVVSAVPADAAAVTEVVGALESSLYPQISSSFSQADLEDEWADLDLERFARVVRDGARVVGYGAVRERGELWRAEGYVHPDAHGRGIGKLLAIEFERVASHRGAQRIQNGVYEADAAARRLLESIGYRSVRLFREMRIEFEGPPPVPKWPVGLHVVAFDPERDALDVSRRTAGGVRGSLGVQPRDLESWSKGHLMSERFDPTLWCVVRAGDEIAAGTICTADTYGGGFVQILFTRRPWRKQGIGAALLADAFRRLWERGERSVGLGVDAASDTGAFRLYERAGMNPELAWVMYEKDLQRGVRAVVAE